jgi:hypothetical protein
MRAGETIHPAITYASDGGIAIYRNGRPYARRKPEIDTPVGRLQTYVRNDAAISFQSSAELELMKRDLRCATRRKLRLPTKRAPVLRAELTAHAESTRSRVETLRAELTRLNQELKAPPTGESLRAEIKNRIPRSF